MAFKIEINAIEYDADKSSLSIPQQGQAVSTVDLMIKIDSQVIPQTYSPVQIFFDNVAIWFGFIQSIQTPRFSSGNEVKLYRLSVQSAECVFNNRLVSKAYEYKTTTEIITDLFNSYITDEGILLGNISTIAEIYKNYNCQFTKLYDVLTELAGENNATFYISADKKFYFESRNDFIEVETPELITDLEVETDNAEMRTVQYILGASEETSLQTESKIWSLVNGIIDNTMTLAYQVKDIASITINATPVNVGIRGVDDGDVTVTFLWEVTSQIISINPNATTKPTNGAIVAVIYYGYFDILVTSVNEGLKGELSTLSGTSGRIEQVLTDESISNLQDAENKAKALLDLNNGRMQEISLYCHDIAKSELFNVWLLDFPLLNITGKYVIVERTITAWGESVEITVKLKSSNFFQGYGTVFRKDVDKKARSVKVYQSASLSDNVSFSDSYEVEYAGLLFFPTETAFSDPLGFDFIPGGM